MNEAILKWLASGTIGLVVCGSLWLAGTVQHEAAGGHMILGKAPAPATRHHQGIHLAARAIEPAASVVTVRTALVLE